MQAELRHLSSGTCSATIRRQGKSRRVLSTTPMMKQEKELFRELTFKGGSVSLVSPRSCLDNGVHLKLSPA
jgi:hypothetical protein